jgi:hypothetical protein
MVIFIKSAHNVSILRAQQYTAHRVVYCMHSIILLCIVYCCATAVDSILLFSILCCAVYCAQQYIADRSILLCYCATTTTQLMHMIWVVVRYASVTDYSTIVGALLLQHPFLTDPDGSGVSYASSNSKTLTVYIYYKVYCRNGIIDLCFLKVVFFLYELYNYCVLQNNVVGPIKLHLI